MLKEKFKLFGELVRKNPNDSIDFIYNLFVTKYNLDFLPKDNLSIEDIENVVCDCLKVNKNKLFEKGRPKDWVVVAKQLCMFFIYFKTKTNLTRLAERYYNNNNHTNPQKGILSIKRKIRENNEVNSYYQQITWELEIMQKEKGLIS